MDAGVNAAAPDHLALDDEGQFVGVSMRQVGWESPEAWRSLNDPIESRRWNLGPRLEAAKSLTRTISRVHRDGFIVGDLNPPNMLLHNENCEIVLIDVDSWGWESSIRATCHRDGYWPPGGFEDASQVTDRFALGVVVIQLLVGCHPFQADVLQAGKDLSDNQSRINRGEAWLVDPARFNLHKKTFPGGHPGLAFFPPSLCDLAERSLDVWNPSRWPGAGDWLTGLMATQTRTCDGCGREAFEQGACPHRCEQRGPRPSPPPTGEPARPTTGEEATREAWLAVKRMASRLLDVMSYRIPPRPAEPQADPVPAPNRPTPIGPRTPSEPRIAAGASTAPLPEQPSDTADPGSQGHLPSSGTPGPAGLKKPSPYRSPLRKMVAAVVAVVLLLAACLVFYFFLL
jgi:DNA-binding helix-hairpin-helix protein with protein kinase domain